MDDMIEKVAKALAKQADDDFLPNKAFWLPYARAAIEAMREPTDEMCLAGFEDASFTNRGIWKSMIDAALQADK